MMGGQAERNAGFRLAQFGVCSWGQDLPPLSPLPWHPSESHTGR